MASIKEHLLQEALPGDLIITMGAGDIWKVGEEYLQEKEGIFVGTGTENLQQQRVKAIWSFISPVLGRALSSGMKKVSCGRSSSPGKRGSAKKWLRRKPGGTPGPPGPTLLAALEEYLQGRRRDLAFPYRLEGTDFQKRVWQALAEIPYGETRTYKQIAAAAGSPGRHGRWDKPAGQTPSLLIPCHRVVASGGLGGFGGGEPLKKYLLRLEGVKI